MLILQSEINPETRGISSIICVAGIRTQVQVSALQSTLLFQFCSCVPCKQGPQYHHWYNKTVQRICLKLPKPHPTCRPAAFGHVSSLRVHVPMVTRPYENGIRKEAYERHWIQPYGCCTENSGRLISSMWSVSDMDSGFKSIRQLKAEVPSSCSNHFWYSRYKSYGTILLSGS